MASKIANGLFYRSLGPGFIATDHGATLLHAAAAYGSVRNTYGYKGAAKSELSITYCAGCLRASRFDAGFARSRKSVRRTKTEGGYCGGYPGRKTFRRTRKP